MTCMVFDLQVNRRDVSFLVASSAPSGELSLTVGTREGIFRDFRTSDSSSGTREVREEL